MLGAALTRGDGQEELAPQKVRVELISLQTLDSATFTGSFGTVLAAGESELMSLIVDPFRDSSESRGCGRVDMRVIDPVRVVPELASHVWEARVTVRSASLEQIELDVDWKRYARGADGETHAVTGDRRSIRLGEGQYHLLDFAEVGRPPAGRELCYRSVGLELKASVAEDPALEERRIAYDLWLIDEAPGERPATRRWQATARHGEARDFDFEELRRPAPGAGFSEGAPSRADTHVGGHVRGRLRSDGALELALVAWRSDSPGHRHWAIGGSGEKRVRVAAGETIRLELPVPTEAPRRVGAVKEEDDRVLALLHEHTVSLVLTARPGE